MNPSEFVSTFLESVGQKQHVELYLRIFRQLPKESFAMVAPEPSLLRHASGVVIEALRFLSELDLRVTLVMGLLGDSGPQAATVVARLNAAQAPFAELPMPTGDAAALREQLNARGNALLDLRALPKEARADALGALVVALGTRKLVVLRSRGGLGPHQHGRLSLDARHSLLTHPSGISVVNLTTDLERLSTRHLGRGEAELLRMIAKLHACFPPLLTSVTSPFHLIHELFTVKGAGTLIKTGSTISHHDGFAELDVPRLAKLIEDTFGKTLRVDLTRIAPAHVYVEQQYRGVAIVCPGRTAAYLSKFAVSPVAQGEGIGRDLWEALTARHPALYWRASPDNPIADWYARECDGLHRGQDWIVYWRGVAPETIPELVADARSRQRDFNPAQASSP